MPCLKAKKSWFLPKFVLFLFIIYAAFTLVSLQVKIGAQREQQEALSTKIEQQQEINNVLEQKIASPQSDSDIIVIAREKLGMAFPGERIFIEY